MNLSSLETQSHIDDVAPIGPEREGITHADLVYGASADEVLDDQGFIDRWQRLCDRCRHATVYQRPGFVRAWYRIYRAEWQPVIIRSVDARGDLQGLWLLAYEENTKTLAHAGTHQAEYHAWLALPGSGAEFLTAAWAQVKKQLVFSSLQFKYLPTVELATDLKSTLGIGSHVSVQIRDRPLLVLHGPDIQPLLSKQSYKRRINGLRKLGTYEFRRLTSAEELNRVFDKLIAYYDFRQGGANQCSPFRDDHNKREFLADLFSSATDDLYVTIAYLDDQPIAAFWGNISNKTVHLGMLIYSPFFAKYSLGKVHVSQLCEALHRDCFDVLDLTPGGDPWKDAFANGHDQVAEAVVYRSRMLGIRDAASAKLHRTGKRCLAKFGVDPESVKAVLRTTSRLRPRKVYRRTRAWFGSRREMRIYRGDRDLTTVHSPDARVRCNSLHDLLCFEAVEPWQKRADFLSEAYTRFGRGEFAYTVAIGDRLAHYGWMVVGQTDSFVTEVKQPVVYPPGSATLYGFYSIPAFRGRGLYRASIATMLSDAFADGRVQQVFISVLADNAASRHVIETMGFKYVGSAHWRSRWGRETRWVDPLLSRPSVRTPEQERSEQPSPE